MSKKKKTLFDPYFILNKLRYYPISFLIVSQSDYLNQAVDTNSHTLKITNSADPNQQACSEATGSGATLFAKAGHIQIYQDQVNTLFN